MRHRLKILGACALALPLVGVAAAAHATSVPPPDDTSQAECEQVDDVSLMLQWVVQSQFAGYVVARDSGIYERYCLNVDLQEPGTDLPPQQFLADGNVDFALAWVPKALSTREAGADIVSIAQVFQRSGTLQVSFADSGVTSVEDFEGQNIGAWCCGNDYEVFAALGQVGLDPSADVTFIQQNFDMNALLDGSIVAAEAMIYNEYAQVLEAVNPDTGELYAPDDLNVISYEELGVGMLQDAIWADESRLADEPEYADIATRLLAASIEGWIWARDNPEAAAEMVVAAGSQLGSSHQMWQMNEINKLIWPSPEGIGVTNADAWQRTVDIALNTPNLEGATVLTMEPSEGSYTNDIVTAAHALLPADLDITGEGFEPIPVEDIELQEGGA